MLENESKWKVSYQTCNGGDVEVIQLTVPNNTHSFKIRGIAKSKIGLSCKILTYKKLRLVENSI